MIADGLHHFVVLPPHTLHGDDFHPSRRRVAYYWCKMPEGTGAGGDSRNNGDFHENRPQKLACIVVSFPGGIGPGGRHR